MDRRSVEAPPVEARTGRRGSGRLLSGDRLGGFIYGTIVALSVVVATSRAYAHDPGHSAAIVAVTSCVFWLAHVYAHGLGESVAGERRLRLDEWLLVGRREFALVEAAVPPVVALLLGALGLISARGAYWLALAVGLAVLVMEGIRFARIERLGLLATVAVVAANLSLGLVLVGLKLAVTHH
jgi:hypothetical protein